MKRYFAINKLVVFMATLLLTLAVATAAMAKGAGDWKDVEGTYIWTQSAQYSNGSLAVKKTEEGDNGFLYEFQVMRGSEKEDSSYNYNTAGIFFVDENGVGESVFVVDDKEVTLTFTLKDKTITVKQNGVMPADVSGAYKFQEKYLAISEAGAAAIIESLPPVKTSLNNTNSPWRLELANEAVGGWFYDIRAFDKNNEMFARFLVAADMTAVYRNDEVKDPILIYGSPATMLTTKTAPLQDEEDEEEGQAPDAVSEENADGEQELVKDQSELSAVVRVGPADPEIKVGNSSKLFVSVPGNLHYKLSGLKSSAGDKVSVDDKGNLTAKAEGTATITGKLTVDDASRDFKVDVTAYVPKLECDALPAHLDIKGKQKLNVYITGQPDTVKAQWSVSDNKIAEIKNGVLTGKADGLVDVTAKTDKMTRTWKVAVGKAELPKEKVEEESSFSPLTLAVPVVLLGGGAWWFMNRRKK